MNTVGCVALVTGGASGLGRATVEALLGAGATVLIADLERSPGHAVAAELGPSAHFHATDVTDADSVSAALAAAAALGSLRVVVNCAGIGPAGRVVGRAGPLPLEKFTQVVMVNLIGTFNVIRLAAAHMAAVEVDGEERGVIVNTASIAAFDGQIGQAAYAASKGGIVSMTLPIARELAASKIRVVTVAPGLFDTPLLATLPQEARDSLGAQVPHPARLGHPGEFGALVAHIVSNPMINGEVIRLDGAIRMAAR